MQAVPGAENLAALRARGWSARSAVQRPAECAGSSTLQSPTAIGLWRAPTARPPREGLQRPLKAPGLFVAASLAALVAGRRGRSGAAPGASRRCRRPRLAQRRSSSEPIFASILSTQKNWRAAVAEIKAEANYLLRSRPKSTWDFGVAFVTGHEGASVVDVARQLDQELGMEGSLLGVASDGSGGLQSDGLRGAAEVGKVSGVMLTAVQLPVQSDADNTANGLKTATPFFIGKKEMLEISQLVCRIQGQTLVRGATDNPTPRAWRRYLLGVEDEQPKGILLFVDPLATKYTVQSVLASLDLAFPDAVKFGGVAADLPPSAARLVAAKGGQFAANGEPGVAGLILPSNCALHSVVTPGSVPVGAELRVTMADGQVVQEINDIQAAKALDEVGREAGPLERLLIERSGFLLGLEAPSSLDPTKSKEYDDQWGSSQPLPSYSMLAKQANQSDWLVRSIDTLPNGTIVVQREDLKQIPPRVGPSWLRMQLHVNDRRRAQKELELMIQRYLGARMTLSRAAPPFGAFVCACSSWEAGGEEVGLAELREVFGEHLPVARAVTHGEVAPTGVALGGLMRRRTARLGHTCSMGFLSYEP